MTSVDGAAACQTPTTLVLDGALTMGRADELRRRLTDALAQAPAVALDCRRAEAVDLSFLQLVLAAAKSAAAEGGRVALGHPAEGALLDTLRRAGLVTGQGTPRGDAWTPWGRPGPAAPPDRGRRPPEPQSCEVDHG